MSPPISSPLLDPTTWFPGSLSQGVSVLSAVPSVRKFRVRMQLHVVHADSRTQIQKPEVAFSECSSYSRGSSYSRKA